MGKELLIQTHKENKAMIIMSEERQKENTVLSLRVTVVPPCSFTNHSPETNRRRGHLFETLLPSAQPVCSRSPRTAKHQLKPAGHGGSVGDATGGRDPSAGPEGSRWVCE